MKPPMASTAIARWCFTTTFTLEGLPDFVEMAFPSSRVLSVPVLTYGGPIRMIQCGRVVALAVSFLVLQMGSRQPAREADPRPTPRTFSKWGKTYVLRVFSHCWRCFGLLHSALLGAYVLVGAPAE